MIKPIVNAYWNDELESVESWVPESSTDFNLLLGMTIGCDAHAGDNFWVRVVSPNNIGFGPESKNHIIVLNEYSWAAVVSSVDEILKKCSDINWFGMQEQLREHFSWEYEDINPPYKK